MHRFDVVVVGAGFAGIACAKELAIRGASVAILEKKKDMERGIHTTGILVNEAADLLNLPEELCTKINQVRIYSPSLRYFEIRSDNYLFLATDTPKLMAYLRQDAEHHGVKFFMGCAFKEARCEGGLVYVNNRDFEARFLIGADGATSRVAEVFGLGKNTEFLVGTEYEYEGVDIDNNRAFYCFINKEYAPGYIGWVIPGPKVMQIGIARTYSDKRHARPDLEGFIEYIKSEIHFKNPTVVERRGGMIPVGGLVAPFYSDNVVLVGDAAGIVSPLTAGGIHTALFYGRRLGQLLEEHLFKNGKHPGKILQKEYPKFLHKHLYRKVFERVPNAVFEIAINFPGVSMLARALFFLKKRLPYSR